MSNRKIFKSLPAVSFAMAFALLIISGQSFGQAPLGAQVNLKSPDVKTRRKAATELGERRDSSAVADLTAALNDTDGEVRVNAVRSLGLIKDKASIPAIISSFKDGDQSVRQQAVVALVTFYLEKNIGFLTNERTGIINRFNPFLDTNDSAQVNPQAQIDDQIQSAIASVALNDAGLQNRVTAIRALGVLNAKGMTPELIKVVKQDRDTRLEVFRVFLKFQEPSNGQYAVPYFNDSDAAVRNQAMMTAAYLHYQEAGPELIRIYQMGVDQRSIPEKIKREPERQWISLEALSLLAPKEAEHIFAQNLASPDASRRMFAAEGIGRIGNKDLVTDVERQNGVEKDADARLAQEFALYKLGREESLGAIIQQLDSKHGDQAAGYILEVNDRSELYRYVSSGTAKTRVRVITALGQIGNEETVERLKPVLANRSQPAEVLNAVNFAMAQIQARNPAAQVKADEKRPGDEEEPVKGRRRRVPDPPR